MYTICANIIRDGSKGYEPDSEELHTFANNSVSQVAGLKLTDILENGMLENCRNMGNYLGKELKDMQKEFPEIGDVRQAGLHIGLELVTGPATGLLAAVRNSGNCIWNYNYSRMWRGK